MLQTISPDSNVTDQKITDQKMMDQKIAEVFDTVFQVSPEQINDSLAPQDVTGWDSLGHVRLVGQLQEQFGVEFEVDEVMRMENVGEIKKILAAKA